MKDLSNDQRLLYEYIIGISQGEVNHKFAAYKIGPLMHARWLTLALRIMSLYTRGVHPDGDNTNIKKLVAFICQVYGPSWFMIKKDNRLQSQAAYMHFQILQIQKQPADVSTPALSTIQFSGWGLLPENMLYCMVASEDLLVREAGLQRVIAIRQQPQEEVVQGKGKGKGRKSKRITQLSQAAIDFEALNWWEIVDLAAPGVEECPMTLELSDAELDYSLKHGTPLNIPKNLPAHSQSVERSVKLVTEASERVFGFEQRHKHINAILLSRVARPTFDSKSTYIEHYDSHLA